MASSSPSARRRHTHHSKHRHHHQGHGSRARRSGHRQSEEALPTATDHPDHSKEGLVHTWLKDLQAPEPRPVVEEEYPAVSGSRRKRSQAHPSSDDWKQHHRYVPESYLALDSLPGTGEGRKRHRHHQGLYKDSSIIAPLDDHHRFRDRVDTQLRCLPATKECYYERGKIRQQTVSEASSLASGAIAHADPHFEKRARRRTRDDRYNTIKNDDAGKDKKSKKKSGKQSRKKRNNMSSAREVMNNFNSNTILNARITVSIGFCFF